MNSFEVNNTYVNHVKNRLTVGADYFYRHHLFVLAMHKVMAYCNPDAEVEEIIDLGASLALDVLALLGTNNKLVTLADVPARITKEPEWVLLTRGWLMPDELVRLLGRLKWRLADTLEARATKKLDEMSGCEG